MRDAEYMRQKYKDTTQDVVDQVLDEIEKKATKSKSLTLYYSVSNEVIQKLRGLGFEVERADSLSQQRDGVYYWINW